MYGLADTCVGGAAAEVAGHGGIYFRVAWLFVSGEEGGGAHDLSGLAVAALGDVVLDPGLLHGVEFTVLGESFDGGYFSGRSSGDWELAGSHGDAVEVYGAGAAKSFAAAEFGADEAEVVAEDPEEWGVVGNVDGLYLSVDIECVAAHRVVRV